MSFRKRNVGLQDTRRTATAAAADSSTVPVPKEKIQLPGTRQSAIDGRPTTSTGSATLDGLFGGHAGLAMGSLILIEETGTTDYAGALLRLNAAEGLVQGHHVHVVGLPEQWGRELPGVVGERGGETESSDKKNEAEKMKIAWRYERLGQFGADAASRGGLHIASSNNTNVSSGLMFIERNPLSSSISEDRSGITSVFCHTFDLAKRLVHPPSAQIDFWTVDMHPSRSPFDAILTKLSASLTSSPPDTVHRIVIPSMLSPALYPPHASTPQYLLHFQHGLQALLATFPTRLIITQSLPLSLYPKSSGTTRWLELLADGVFELVPFPHSADAEFQASRDPATKEEPPQGLLRVHKLPIFHDRGSGTIASDNDWTFALSRRKFTIKPFNLPPIEGDTEAQQSKGDGDGSERKPKKADMEF